MLVNASQLTFRQTSATLPGINRQSLKNPKKYFHSTDLATAWHAYHNCPRFTYSEESGGRPAPGRERGAKNVFGSRDFPMKFLHVAGIRAFSHFLGRKRGFEKGEKKRGLFFSLLYFTFPGGRNAFAFSRVEKRLSLVTLECSCASRVG